jgi:hypothetical protein
VKTLKLAVLAFGAAFVGAFCLLAFGQFLVVAFIHGGL